MNVKKCSNGHFYDGDVYAACPYCQSQEEGANPTVPIKASSDVTTPLVFTPSRPAEVPVPDDDGKTVSFYQQDNETLTQKDPVVGWLVCIEGKLLGEDFRLKTGRNFIGRGQDMDIALLGENTVSRSRHAIIIYEPRENIFLAQPGESKELFYLNGKVVLSPTEMKKNDILQIGELSLMFVPFCDEKFSWKK